MKKKGKGVNVYKKKGKRSMGKREGKSGPSVKKKGKGVHVRKKKGKMSMGKMKRKAVYA